ncbi:MAG: cation:proton antiporter [Alphaproteobacteria bacterium]|nr:cation:proton antiporter [Alphaproteobacteria bacterium]
MIAETLLFVGLPTGLVSEVEGAHAHVQALLFIGMLIVLAKLAEGVLSRVGLSSIVAYTAAGILLGPVTGLVEITAHIKIFLDIGVFIFFFLIGLDEIDIPGFMSTIRGRYFVAATVSVIISIVASLVVTYRAFTGLDFALDLEFNHALALAGILSLSSLGLVAKVLADKGLLKELIGLRIFTAVIIAEVIALLVVGLTIGEDSSDLSVVSVFQLLGQIAGFTVVIWIVSAKALPRVMALLQRFLNVPELSYGLLIGGLFLVVVGAENIGLHGSLGALLFGAALSGLPHRMREDIMPGMRSTAEGLFVPLFFASAGLHLSFSFIELAPLTIIALLFIPMVGKMLASFIGTYLARLDTPIVLSTGLMGKGVAEIALLLVLLETQVIGHDVFSLLVIIMFGYILLMPPVISMAVSKARMPEELSQPGTMMPSFARHALAGVMVGSVMDRTRAYPDPEVTVNDFLDDWLVPDQTDYLIVERGVPVGTVSLTRVNFRRRLFFWRRGSFGETTLKALMRRGPPHSNPDEPIQDALERMAENSMTIIPVMDRNTGEFLGMVSSNEILELVALMDEIRETARQLASGDD